MVSFFPMIYEGEILYSAIARYNIRSGNISPKATLEDVVGSRTVSAVMALPSNIDNFIKNMPINCKYTSEEIIYKHTLFPFYTAFLSPQRAENIYQLMKGDNGGDIYNSAGIMASSVKENTYFKFCPQCNKENKLRWGEFFWNRIHQIPSITICLKHETLLLNSKVLIHSQNKHEFICATEENCCMYNTVFYPNETLDRVSILAKDIEKLFNAKFSNMPMAWFEEQYTIKLIHLGIANVNGQIKQNELVKSFIDYYGEEFLTAVQSTVSVEDESNWISMIVRKHRKTFHTIRHLLLMQYLGLDLKELFKIKQEYKPFGDGPWPCLNGGAEHYLKPIVEKLEITYDCKGKKVIGTFICSCGFIYSRGGPDVDKLDRYKIGRIKNFGSVWEERLKELFDKRLRLRAIARELRVDAKTVEKYADILGLELYWRTETVEKVADLAIEIFNDNKKDKQHYRNEWRTLIGKFPKKSKTELRNMNKGVYIWLYRNDRKWLNESSPKVIKKFVVNNRVDWAKRDEEILIEVKNAIEIMSNSQGKPERITISSIGKKIDKLDLIEKHLDKLWLTKDCINANIESNDEFRNRRISWAINILNREGEDVKVWKVVKKAGLRTDNGVELLVNSILYDKNI
ncbi:TnsD family transposase [Clostridium estertheticum]|uniref:TnsD family Tn7-like transposition protein n=1 Tax=Clostridium estertheticum TaxID=238834 RepID=UPI0013E95911|nr:TnsD family Tn7-like transposition protein [Clostridium estertheticum]MBZ9689339.1 TnsD family transposase [Clostridium estertheticum]